MRKKTEKGELMQCMRKQRTPHGILCAGPREKNNPDRAGESRVQLARSDV